MIFSPCKSLRGWDYILFSNNQCHGISIDLFDEFFLERMSVIISIKGFKALNPAARFFITLF